MMQKCSTLRSLFAAYRLWFSTPMFILTLFFALCSVFAEPSSGADITVSADGDGLHLNWNNIVNVILGVLISAGLGAPFVVFKLTRIGDLFLHRLEVLEKAHQGEAQHALYLRSNGTQG